LSVDNGDATRRGALKALAVGGTAVACGSLGVPALELLVAPARGAAGAGARWIRTVRLDSLEEGKPKRVSVIADNRDAWVVEKSVELGGVWLIRKGAAVQCFSVVCPHLGCSVTSVADGFNCPCHDSGFNGQGVRTGGPSPRDMDPLDARVEDGYVMVDFHKFRQGTADRVRIT
jgi:quinol---cytochrome c reductase iron-sulfur subunit, bacillus type